MSEYSEKNYKANVLKLILSSLPSIGGTLKYCHILQKLQYAAYCLCEEYIFLEGTYDLHGIKVNRWVINKLLEDELEIHYVADRFPTGDETHPWKLIILTYPEFYNGVNPALLPELEIASIRFYC